MEGLGRAGSMGTCLPWPFPGGEQPSWGQRLCSSHGEGGTALACPGDSTKGAGVQPGVAMGWRDFRQAGAGKNCSFFPSPGEAGGDASILHTLRIEEFLCIP